MKAKWAIQLKTHQTQKTLLTCKVTVRCITFHNCKIIILYSQKLYFSQSRCKIMVKCFNWQYHVLLGFGFVYFNMMFSFFYLSMRRKMLEEMWGHLWPRMILYCKKHDGTSMSCHGVFSLDTFFMAHTQLYIIFLSNLSNFNVLKYWTGVCHPNLMLIQCY